MDSKDNNIHSNQYIELDTVKGISTPTSYGGEYHFKEWNHCTSLINLQYIVYIESSKYYNMQIYVLYMNCGTKDVHHLWILPETYNKLKQYLNYKSINI